MAEPRAVLPGALGPDSFFGRAEELRGLRRMAAALARGAGRSRALCARPGAGKSELLRQWHGRLFDEGRILPFSYAVPREAGDPAALAADMVGSLALQALAFRRRDPRLLTRPLSDGELAEGLRAAWGAAGAALAESLAAAGGALTGRRALVAAALLPHRLAATSGTRVLCLLDDAGNLAAALGGGCWPEEATTSPIAPSVFALDDESVLPQVFGPAAATQLTLERLGPLSREASSELARHLARAAGLDPTGAEVTALALEAGGSPFYLGALVRELAARPGSGLLEIARASASARCEGELARYWTERFGEAIPDRRVRATALEILAYCLHEGEPGPDAGRLAERMLKPEADVESALAGLSRAGIARVAFTRVVVDDDPVLHDVALALYRREFGRMTWPALTAALAAEKARGSASLRRRMRQGSLREALRGLLAAWSGQDVPAVLFDAGAFAERHGGAAIEEVAAAGAGEADTRALPRVASVASGRVGSALAHAEFEVDALAWTTNTDAAPEAAAPAWVVRVLPGGAGGAEQLARFDGDVAALQAAGDLPSGRLVRWALLEAPLDAEGRSAAAGRGILTSTSGQLEALARLIGVPLELPPPEPLEALEPDVELELVIPRAAEIELVAARALEQLGENLGIDAPAIGRLKVALVEACINAFEHGGSPEGRVRVAFTVARGRLEMRVENRGRPLAALPPRAAAGRDARGRGWGLTLIRELVDEVALEPREDGVCLLMVKYLERGNHG